MGGNNWCAFVYFPEGVNGGASNVLEKSAEASKQSESSSLVFTPDVIVHVASSGPLSRTDLKVIETRLNMNHNIMT